MKRVRRHWLDLAGALVLVALAAALSPPLTGQEPKPSSAAKSQIRVGLLPFIDNTVSGGEDVGIAVSRAVQAELTHSTSLVGRVLTLDGVKPDDLDGEKAVEIGRERGVDAVLLGTVLEATSEESGKNIQSPSVFGQSVGGGAQSVKGTVTLQGDLYNVADGTKIESIRVTGQASDRKVGTNVQTSLGGLSTGGSSFQNSALGKALNNAVADLVKRIAAEQRKITRGQSPGPNETRLTP